jgi:hypothetical protein
MLVFFCGQLVQTARIDHKGGGEDDAGDPKETPNQDFTLSEGVFNGADGGFHGGAQVARLAEGSDFLTFLGDLIMK